MSAAPTRALARAVVALLLVATPAGSQPPAPPAPTADPLGDYVRAALRENLGLRQARTDADRAEVAVREAVGLYLPTLALDTRRSRLDGVVNIGDFVNPANRALNQLTGSGDFPTNVNASLPFAQETHLRLTQPVLAPRVRANHDARRALRDAQDAALAGAARQLAADVQRGYLAYAGAARVVEVQAATLALVDEQQRVAERRLAAGAATPDVVLRARADRAEVAQQLAEAEAQREAARRAFNQLRNRPLEEPVPLLADSLFDSPLPDDPDALVAHALARREELRQAERGESAARAQERAARAAFLPTVGVGVDYGIQGRDYRWNGRSDFLVLSLVGSWNLFNGGQDAARREQAALEVERARLRGREGAQQVELQVRTAWDQARVARAALATADERLAAAERTHALVRRRWEQGLAPQVELLDARSAFTRAALNQAITRYAYAGRWVELERAAALRELGY
jgi:outer membrane protein TolC